MAFPTQTVEIDFDDNPTPSYYEATLALNPVVYYRMNEVVPSPGGTLTDYSGNGHTATVTGGTAPFSQQPSLIAGDPDYSLLGLPATVFNVPDLVSTVWAAGSYTLEYWFQLGGAGSGVNFGHGSTPGPGWNILHVANDQVWLGTNLGTVAVEVDNVTSTRTGIHHLAFVAAGSKLFLDGVLLGSSGVDAPAAGGGASPKFTLEPGGATVDEVAAYAYSMTEDQVAEHYYSALTNVTPTYTDVTSCFISGSTKRGRSQERDQIEAGTGLAVLDDTDSRFEPTNGHGPYYGRLLPLRRLRKKWTFNGTTYTRFAGMIAAFPLVWERPSEARAELPLVDGFEQLQQADISGLSWGAELSGARVNHVLDACLWPRSLRRVDAGYATVQATSFVAASGQAGLAHIQDVCDTELGYFFISGDGYATFHDRFHRDIAPRSVLPQATLGDGDGQLPYEDIELEYTKDRVLNNVKTTTQGGTVQTANDGPSLARYYRRSLVRSTINTTDADSLVQSQLLVARNKDAILRVNSVTFAPATIQGDYGDWLWAQILGAEIGDRFTVAATPPGGGDVITLDCYLEQITDEYAGDVQWTTTWQLSPAGARRGGLDSPAARFPALIEQPQFPVQIPIQIPVLV